MADSKQPYFFSGHALGAAARFHRLDEARDLNHVIPTLGASVLAATGGYSKSEVSNYCFNVDHPRKRSLLAVRRILVASAGRESPGSIETEVECEIDAISVVEKLHIDKIRLHFLSVRDENGQNQRLSSKGTAIDGIRLGAVEAKITLDDELICECVDKNRLSSFYASQSESFKQENSSRFQVPATHPPSATSRQYKCTLVRQIKLSGPEKDLQKMSVDGNTIV